MTRRDRSGRARGQKLSSKRARCCSRLRRRFGWARIRQLGRCRPRALRRCRGKRACLRSCPRPLLRQWRRWPKVSASRPFPQMAGDCRGAGRVWRDARWRRGRAPRRQWAVATRRRNGCRAFGWAGAARFAASRRAAAARCPETACRAGFGSSRRLLLSRPGDRRQACGAFRIGFRTRT